MNIVSFFAPRFAADHQGVVEDYLAMLAILEESCARLGLRHIVITDGTIDLDHAVFRPPLPDNLMQATLAGQLAYLKDALFDRDTAFVDADCLVARNPGSLFVDRFDMALTGRYWGKGPALAPINNGAMYVRRASRDRCVTFFERAAAVCGPEWGADQWAIAETCEPMPDAPTTKERSGALIRFLKLYPWNYPPRTIDDAGALDAVVLHFKGARKSFMEAMWRKIAKVPAWGAMCSTFLSAGISENPWLTTFADIA